MADETVGGEKPADAIDIGKAQTSTATATGQEALARSDNPPEIPQGEDRGSKVPVEEDIQPDFLHEGAKEPIGLQAEPAQFVANGSIPPNHVASNSGLVPVSAVTSSQDEAKDRMEQEKKQREASTRKAFMSRKKLSDEEIGRMGGSELRAVAHDRGYDFSDAMGTRSTRQAFRAAQDEDKSLDEASED